MAAKKKEEAAKSSLSVSDKIWSELTGFLLVLIALFLIAALGSFNLNMGLPLAGKIGVSLSKLVFHWLGFAAHFIPLLLLIIGVNMIRLASGGKHLFSILSVVVAALWLAVGLGYVARNHELQLGSSQFAAGDTANVQWPALARDLLDTTNNQVSNYLYARFSPAMQEMLAKGTPEPKSEMFETAMLEELNRALSWTALYDSARFAGVKLDPPTRRMLSGKQRVETEQLNRRLLEQAYPGELKPRFRFYAAGSAGYAVSAWLVDQVGHAGLIILLIAYATILLVVLTPIRHKFGDGLRGLLSGIRKLGTRPIVPERPKLITQKPVVVKSEGGKARGRNEEPEQPEPANAEADEPDAGLPTRPLPRVTQPTAPRALAGKFSFEAQDFLNLLHEPTVDDQPVKDEKEAQDEASLLLSKLKEFGIDGRIENIYSGPVITRFELIPAPGIKIQRIESLSDDLALSLRAERIRILAPIPGKNAVGIEIPNRERKMVYLRSVLESEAFHNQTSPLGFALGTTITGEPYCADLSGMPHVLIAGTTGSGKSVCINALVSSIIFRSSYEDVRFLTIDPKRLELPIYDPIPHLLFPTTVNSKEAVQKLDYVLGIMEMRYRDFAKVGARDIAGYNEKAAGKGHRRKPYIVVIIDELADLMITAPAEIEEKITRLAQMSRAVGIHLVLATQRPSVDVITGLIKANFPCRMAFQVASKTDSRTILDMNGAESLLGRGDGLFLPPGKGEPLRLHGAFISAEETQGIVNLLARRYLTQLLTGLIEDELVEPAAEEIVAKDLHSVLSDPGGVAFEERKRRLSQVIPENIVDTLLANGYYQKLEESLPLPGTPEAEAVEAAAEDREIDEYFNEAAKIVVRHQEASVSMLQRRLDIGWARAGRIIDQLEQAGIVGPYVGSKSRKVLVESEADLGNMLAGQAWFGVKYPDQSGPNNDNHQ